MAPWQRWTAHAGVNTLPSGCASAPGSSAAFPASAAAVKTGAKGRKEGINRFNEHISAGLKMLMRCMSTCHMFEGELWTRLNGQSICRTAFVDCLTLTVQEFEPSDSIKSILIVLSQYRIDINSGFSFWYVQKQNKKNVRMETCINVGYNAQVHTLPI